MVRYAMLGPVGVCDGERRVSVGGPRQVALLALLLLNANRAVSSDELIDALWGDLGPQGALKRLQVAIVRLRRTLDALDARGEPALRPCSASAWKTSASTRRDTMCAMTTIEHLRDIAALAHDRRRLGAEDLSEARFDRSL